MSAPAIPAPRTVTLPTGTSLTITEYGDTGGRTVLALHSGAGPQTLTGFATALSEDAHVIVPTYPGFNGTPGQPTVATVADLAEAYLDLLDLLDLSDVTLLGNSVGGWVAAEMALRDNHQRIGAVVLVNACGIHAELPANRIVDTRLIDPAEIGKLSFANAAFRPDFAAMSDAQRAGAAANQVALARYGGEHFTFDPALRARLHRVTLPVLVIWGEQDHITPIGYGRGYAGEFPDSRFVPIPDAGHFPQIEQLDATLAAFEDFVDSVRKPGEPR
ncbi:alpha/beta hydrolase [Amycolatopsis sp. NBC_01488]|uniref:alpha/beta fold hydrolase n=1 Tax=Amycolatopsis sp. NBC_01488 TaxID=2903563 RepID=UPI002E2D92AD|nr:alpha/beta hydrolase [Amycolatopsis sp. NBC_01488]